VPNGEVHVVPSDKGWRVEVDDRERAHSLHPTQADAIAAAREIARASERELCIHGRNGEIRDRVYRGNASRKGPRALIRRASRPPLPAWSVALVAAAVVVVALALTRATRERWS
jgi:hypothetical protein